MANPVKGAATREVINKSFSEVTLKKKKNSINESEGENYVTIQDNGAQVWGTANKKPLRKKHM